MSEKNVEIITTPVDTETNCTEGAEYLYDIKYDRKFSEQQLEYWCAELEKANPKLDKGMIRMTIDMFSTNPEIFEEITADHKANPEKYAIKTK
tara:strand:- start:182 stop:460 length:279 start_codon:yes stop_codon:yes gene_type:complete